MRRDIGLGFSVIGVVGLTAAASLEPIAALALAWFSISVLVVAWAYLRDDPRVFGKRRDGTRRAAATLLLLPYLGLLGLTWQLVRLGSREPAISALDERVLLARRLLASELPNGVATIVDLTCEQVEPPVIRELPGYLCLATLDGAAPCFDELCAAIEQIAVCDGVVLIHCAQGHGRTGLLAAALLLRRALARTPEQALARVREARPGVRLSRSQERALLEYAEHLARLSTARAGG